MTGTIFRRIAGFLLAAILVAANFGAPDSTAIGASLKPVAVVELFTSQGCSSCPPADKLLEKYAKREDVVALTFPVDYWDYLGWKDTLASPTYSARQRSYARARRDGQVYTPQVVVNGLRHANGSHEKEINRAIAKTQKTWQNNQVALKMWTEGDALIIQAGAAPEGTRVKPATIWLALVKKAETVVINRGENRGRTITYHSVVREMTPVGRWTGQEVTVKLPKEHLMSGGSDGCTVLLQQDTAGPILAAAEMKDW